ncbi:xanthine dehydrogenase family protein subunit M [bacterium]|nr:xanthine dehydrogenase family protein subunit M [bacterium]
MNHEIQYFRPNTLKEAASFFSDNPFAYPIAGGTDILVKWKNGGLPQLSHFVDVRKIVPSMIVKENGKVIIGAGCAMNVLALDPFIAGNFPALSSAAWSVGSFQIRNMATIGGNVANASPAGDTIPALLALDANVILGNSAGTRKIPILEFFSGPGKTVLKRGDLIEGFEVKNCQTKGAFLKLGTRASNAISKVSLALSIFESKLGSSEFRIALGAVASTVIRCKKAETILGESSAPFSNEVLNEAMVAVQEISKPIDDIRSAKVYRKKMAGVLLKRALIALRLVSSSVD